MKWKMDENHNVIYDGYKQSIEGIDELRDDVKEIKAKVDGQEIEPRVIRAVNKNNTLQSNNI